MKAPLRAFLRFIRARLLHPARVRPPLPGVDEAASAGVECGAGREGGARGRCRRGRRGLCQPRERGQPRERAPPGAAPRAVGASSAWLGARATDASASSRKQGPGAVAAGSLGPWLAPPSVLCRLVPQQQVMPPQRLRIRRCFVASCPSAASSRASQHCRDGLQFASVNF